MKFPGAPALSLAAVLVILLLASGCETLRGGQQNAFREAEYKKMMERQKQGALAAEQDSAKPAATASPEELEARGDAYLKQGNADMAFFQYEMARRKMPENRGLRYKIGVLLLTKRLYEEADKEFSAILEKNPEDAAAHEGRGRALFHRGMLDAAEEHLLKAVVYDPNASQAYNYLAIVYDLQGKYDMSLSCHEKSLSIKPTAEGFNNLGVLFLRKGAYEDAVKAFRDSLKLDNTIPRTYNNLGLALMKLGRQDEAFEAFAKAEGEAAAHNNIGQFLMEEGKYEAAIAAFEKAIERSPRYYAKAHENLKKARLAAEKVSQK